MKTQLIRDSRLSAGWQETNWNYNFSSGTSDSLAPFIQLVMLSITVISALFYLTIVWNFQYVASFSVARIQSKVTTHVLSMGGGRSPAERGMSKRNMFKELRSKLNEAAKMPGFFEVGEGPPVSCFVTFNNIS